MFLIALRDIVSPTSPDHTLIQSIVSYPNLVPFILTFLNIFCDGSPEKHLPSVYSFKISKHMGMNPTVIKTPKNNTGTIIFMNDFGQLSGALCNELTESQVPYMKVICPPANIIPISGLNGSLFPSWFDFDDRNNLHNTTNLEGLHNATSYIHEFIDGEIKTCIPPDRIVIGGIAQGAALALNVAVTYPRKLGAVIVLSPWDLHPITLKKALNSKNKDIPIFHGHVTNSTNLTDYNAEKIAKVLKEQVSNNTEFKLYEGTNTFTKEEFQDMKAFCQKHIDGRLVLVY